MHVVKIAYRPIPGGVGLQGGPKDLHNEIRSRYLNKRINKQWQRLKIVQIHSESVQCVVLAAGRHIPAGDATH